MDDVEHHIRARWGMGRYGCRPFDRSVHRQTDRQVPARTTDAGRSPPPDRIGRTHVIRVVRGPATPRARQSACHRRLSTRCYRATHSVRGCRRRRRRRPLPPQQPSPPTPNEPTDAVSGPSTEPPSRTATRSIRGQVVARGRSGRPAGARRSDCSESRPTPTSFTLSPTRRLRLGGQEKQRTNRCSAVCFDSTPPISAVRSRLGRRTADTVVWAAVREESSSDSSASTVFLPDTTPPCPEYWQSSDPERTLFCT
jgi:hypothetical protein